MDSVSWAAAGAAGTAAAAYIDAKYHLRKDLRTIWRLKTADRVVAKAAKESRQSMYYNWEDSVNLIPTARAIWSRTGIYSFEEAHRRVLQYAGFLQSLGVKPKESIALYAPNSPEFIFIILAMWAIGCYPAMINYNLADASLAHCISVAKTKLIIVDAEEPGLRDRIEAVGDRISESGAKPAFLDAQLKQHITTLPAERPADSLRQHAVGDFPWALIYTSGTTGLPKAFPIQTQRVCHNCFTNANGLEQRRGKDPNREVWYDCMPLYHGTGIIVGTTHLVGGMTLAIGKKFSASSFWRDIHDSEATAFAYVGEVGRYLLAAPPSPLDRGHKVRVMYGNGLRPDVWDRFKARFGVEEVFEFFTSTEGMFALSVWDRSGFGARSVGHHGAIFRWILHKTYVPVAIDPNTNDMWRDAKTGFGKRVPYSQGGEMIVKLNSKAEWPGYFNNKEGTNKKFATDVFEKGDIYYRPGDALRRTDDGLWYFMDRLGDTFRWKGENVATAEVQEVMGAYPSVGEANVYGVEIPGAEGRAGCAAVILDGVTPEQFDWQKFTAYLQQKLPKYAVPLFVRVIRGAPETMGTHNNKQNKVPLRLEGADLSAFGSKVAAGGEDVMYWLTPGSASYVRYGEKDSEDVKNSRVKL